MKRFYLLVLLMTVSCASINDYGSQEVHWGKYGNAWRCNVTYLNQFDNGSTGVLNDFTDLITKPIQITLNTVTLRFLWGTNGVGNYFLEIGSILPGYSHCDAAFWYDFGLKSIDIEENNSDSKSDSDSGEKTE